MQDSCMNYWSPILDRRCSHRPMIVHMLKENGANPLELGIAPDDPERIMEKLREGLGKADLVLTIGGCSRGEGLCPRRDQPLR